MDLIVVQQRNDIQFLKWQL